MPRQIIMTKKEIVKMIHDRRSTYLNVSTHRSCTKKAQREYEAKVELLDDLLNSIYNDHY